jgi:hypothetical protein
LGERDCGELSGERAAHIRTCSLYHSNIELAWEIIPMTHDFKVGEHVEWNSETGRVRGTIKKKITSEITFKGYTVHASKEKPQYLIKTRPTTWPCTRVRLSKRSVKSNAQPKNLASTGRCHREGFLTRRDREHLAGGFFRVSCKYSLGYVIVVRRTLAKGVSVWTWRRVGLMMSSVRIPRTNKASAMSERWQRQGTASAHINAMRSWFANRINSSRLLSNSGVCM